MHLSADSADKMLAGSNRLLDAQIKTLDSFGSKRTAVSRLAVPCNQGSRPAGVIMAVLGAAVK